MVIEQSDNTSLKRIQTTNKSNLASSSLQKLGHLNNNQYISTSPSSLNPSPAPIKGMRELRRPPHTEEIKPQSETGVFIYQVSNPRGLIIERLRLEAFGELLKGTF